MYSRNQVHNVNVTVITVHFGDYDIDADADMQTFYTNQNPMILCFKHMSTHNLEEKKVSNNRISTASLKVFKSRPPSYRPNFLILSLSRAADPISGRRVAAAFVLGAAADGSQFWSHRHLHGPRGKHAGSKTTNMENSVFNRVGTSQL